MTPALMSVDNLPDDLRLLLRAIFRELVYSRAVTQDLGQEGAEEALEKMYNSGFIRLTFEPTSQTCLVGRMMMYSDEVGGYKVIEKIEISTKDGIHKIKGGI